MQARSCATLGSALYEELLDRAARDVEEEGATWQVLQTVASDPTESMPALRFMGAVHRLVLEGRAEKLAEFYPSAGGRVGPGAADAFLETVAEHPEALIEGVRRPVQTNEVGRCSALAPGFLFVAKTTGLPLRILEVGSSAGLNLRWDRYFYEARGRTWGGPGSPVHLCSYNSERPLPFDVPAVVAERRGCDRAPLDPTTREGVVTLTSYLWPDQVHRLRLLRSALEVARGLPVQIDAAAAGRWVEERLAIPTSGVVTVVFHSIVMQYLADEERRQMEEAIVAAGEAVTDAPLAWLRMEPSRRRASLWLDLWRAGGRREPRRRLASAGYHGQATRWLA